VCWEVVSSIMFGWVVPLWIVTIVTIIFALTGAVALIEKIRS
jgi:hypothetical protein